MPMSPSVVVGNCRSTIVEGGSCSPTFAKTGVIATKALLFFLEIQNCLSLVRVLEESFVVFKRPGAPKEIENAEDMMMSTFDRSMY